MGAMKDQAIREAEAGVVPVLLGDANRLAVAGAEADRADYPLLAAGYRGGAAYLREAARDLMFDDRPWQLQGRPTVDTTGAWVSCVSSDRETDAPSG